MLGFIRIAGLVIMMIVGICVGVNMAEKNIHQLQGIEGAPQSIQITPRNGKLEITMMGKSVVETSIDEQKITEVTAQAQQEVGRIMTIGNWIGSGMRDMTRTVIDWFTNWLR